MESDGPHSSSFTHTIHHSMNRFSLHNFQQDRSAKTKAKTLCFRTDTHGNIPISSDWQHVFEETRQLNNYYLQTRHNHARLIIKSPSLEFTGSKDKLLSVQTNGFLSLHTSHWHHATAQVDICPCCQSPGLIDFTGKYNTQFMQISAPSDLPIGDWATFVKGIAYESPFPSTTLQASHNASLNYMPNNICISKMPIFKLPSFLQKIKENDGRVKIYLPSKETLHMQSIVPNYVNFDGNLLTVKGDNATLQTALITSIGIYEFLNDEINRIYLAGNKGTIHVAFEAEDTFQSQQAWNDAFKETLS